MKTIKEIKDEVAQEAGYESAENYLIELYETGSIYTIERITLFVNEVAIRTAKEALKNASENAYLIESIPNSAMYDTIDKQSILNESNIPKL